MKCKHVSMCQDAALQQLSLYFKLQTVAHVVTLFALLVSRSSVKMIFFFPPARAARLRFVRLHWQLSVRFLSICDDMLNVLMIY